MLSLYIRFKDPKYIAYSRMYRSQYLCYSRTFIHMYMHGLFCIFSIYMISYKDRLLCQINLLYIQVSFVIHNIIKGSQQARLLLQ